MAVFVADKPMPQVALPGADGCLLTGGRYIDALAGSAATVAT